MFAGGLDCRGDIQSEHFAKQKLPQPFGHGGEIISSGLPYLFGIDLRAARFVLVQVELLEQLALPNE